MSIRELLNVFNPFGSLDTKVIFITSRNITSYFYIAQREWIEIRMSEKYPEIILERTLAIFKPCLLKKEVPLIDILMKQGITVTQVIDLS